MAELPRKAKVIAALIGVAILTLFAVGAWQALAKQSLESWLREQDKPVSAQMQKGAQLYQQGRYAEADAAFREAYSIARNADRQAQERWKEYIDTLPEPRKLSTPISSAARYGKGLTYFKSRMVEAATGAASSIVTLARTKYRKELETAAASGNAFLMPATDLAPAVQMIDEGLAAIPQNEALRLLRAQIFTLRGMYADALNALNELLLVNSESAEAYNQMGLIYCSPAYLNSDNYQVYREKALAMFEKAALLKDMSGQSLADPHYNLGMYYATPPEGKPENALPEPADATRAVKHLQRYLEITGGATPQAGQVRAMIARLQAVAR